ncbi:uncharacterized protein V6R79_011500 [Siganus canaliculatus]
MALVTVQRSPTPSTTSSPCVSESGSGEDDRRSQPRRERKKTCTLQKENLHAVVQHVRRLVNSEVREEGAMTSSLRIDCTHKNASPASEVEMIQSLQFQIIPFL